MSDAYLRALHRGFEFAAAVRQRCGPVHLLVGLAEGEGPAASALAADRTLREVVSGRDQPPAAATALHMQAQEAARTLAGRLGQALRPEHLLIALLDQARPEVLDVLAQAGIDAAGARAVAVAAIGASVATLPMPSLTPAGTLDRPPLSPADLDERALAELRWRQDHLPLDMLRGPGDVAALRNLEARAAWKAGSGLDDDQRHSLLAHHLGEVRVRVERAKPELAGPGRRRALPGAGRRRRRRLRRLLSFATGWRVWLGNRQVSLRDKWFWLRTRRYYQHAPRG